MECLALASEPAESIRCCCGDEDERCPFFRQGQDTIKNLETNLQHVASVGQALLARHEAYVADTAKELAHRSSQIADLEDKNEGLRTENARVLAENDTLVGRIDTLNRSVDESETQITSLTATLRRTETETQRLKSLAARTETLEEQLTQLETEMELLQGTLDTTAENERVAKHRWRESQRIIFDLETQLELIERDAATDRPEHAHPRIRTERQRPYRTLTDSVKPSATLAPGATNAVTKFLKEVIEENARLQLNAAELQSLLVRSQEESAQLREQVAASSPQREDVKEFFHDHDRSLELELQPIQSLPSAQDDDKMRPPRLPLFSSNRLRKSMRWSSDSHYSRPSVSTFSALSSPQARSYPTSTWAGNTSDSDSTRPTSPGSAWSPTTKPVSSHTDVEELGFQPLSLVENGRDSGQGHCETSHNKPQRPGTTTPGSSITKESAAGPYPSPPPRRPQLHRVSSSSSLYSISGMDVHSTLPSRREMTPATLRIPRLLSDRVERPLLSATMSSATSARSSERDVSKSPRKSLGDGTHAKGYTPLVDTFGNRVGGWLSGRWSAGQQEEKKLASPSVDNLRNAINKSNANGGRSVKRSRGRGQDHKRRSVLTSALDQDALEECLNEDEASAGR